MSFINANDTEVYYEKYGHGDSNVILLHGWGQSTKGMEIISQGMDLDKFSVYNIDFPGFGNSPLPSFAWSVYDYNDMLEQFIEKLNIKNPTLVGHSFGGRISIIYGSRNTNLNSIVFIDAAGVKPKKSLYSKVRVMTFKAMKNTVKTFYSQKRTKEYLDNLNSIFGSGDYNATDPKLRQIFIKTVNEDLVYLMPKINVKCKLIWGDNDDFTPLEDAYVFKKNIKNASLVHYPNAGHYSYLDNYAEFIKDFNDFIQGGE